MSLRLLRRALTRVQPLMPTVPGQSWILVYHLVGGGTGLPIDLVRERFEAQLDALAQEATLVPLSSLIEDIERGPLSSRPTCLRVVLTFDDALLNFYDVALPILADRSAPATLYVPSGFINREGVHPFSDRDFHWLKPMTWEQLREAQAAGIEIGSHTHTHANLVGLPASRVAMEFVSSQREILQQLGTVPSSVSYPRALVSSSVATLAGEYYRSGVAAGGLPVGPNCDLLRLPRLPVCSDTSPDTLVKVLTQAVHLEEWVADKVRSLRSHFDRESCLSPGLAEGISRRSPATSDARIAPENTIRLSSGPPPPF